MSTLVEEEDQQILLLDFLAAHACMRALRARLLLSTTHFRMRQTAINEDPEYIPGHPAVHLSNCNFVPSAQTFRLRSPHFLQATRWKSARRKTAVKLSSHFSLHPRHLHVTILPLRSSVGGFDWYASEPERSGVESRRRGMTCLRPPPSLAPHAQVVRSSVGGAN